MYSLAGLVNKMHIQYNGMKKLIYATEKIWSIPVHVFEDIKP